MDDLDGLRDIALIQSALRRDFEFIARYGEEHPGAWAGAWFENEPDVRIVAGYNRPERRQCAHMRMPVVLVRHVVRSASGLVGAASRIRVGGGD